ncbi:transposable element Tcb1 transposase [Trichonephila clavipes]|nr:transposable element Tcb1 transposase [Trichonephila clavipes]
MWTYSAESIRGTWKRPECHIQAMAIIQDDGNVSRCYSTGRPRVTTPNEDRYIYLAVTAKRNRRSPASDLSRQLSSATGMTVSRQTVYRCLGYIGVGQSDVFQLKNSLSPVINLE